MNDIFAFTNTHPFWFFGLMVLVAAIAYEAVAWRLRWTVVLRNGKPKRYYSKHPAERRAVIEAVAAGNGATIVRTGRTIAIYAKGRRP